MLSISVICNGRQLFGVFSISNFLQVTDGENTSRATLRIIVEDVNDNAPQFEKQFYLINILKDVELGSTIAKIRANDPDTGLAGTVRYELSANSVKDFRIDPESGTIDSSILCKLINKARSLQMLDWSYLNFVFEFGFQVLL